MTSFRQWAPLLFVLTAVTLASCAPSECEQYRAWRNEGSQTCQMCLSGACMDERTAAVRMNTQSQCGTEFSCASRCPNGSDTTCGCLEACFTTTAASMACRTTYFNSIECGVRNCESSCR